MFASCSVKYNVGKMISEQAKKLIMNAIHGDKSNRNNTILLN